MENFPNMLENMKVDRKNKKNNNISFYSEALLSQDKSFKMRY